MNVTNLCLNVDIKVNLNYQGYRFWMIFIGNNNIYFSN